MGLFLPLRGSCRRRRRWGSEAEADGNRLTPPVSAWRRCHPPLREGMKTRSLTKTYAHRGTLIRQVHAYPRVFSVPSTQYVSAVGDRRHA
jgi:hypothetical protein